MKELTTLYMKDRHKHQHLLLLLRLMLISYYYLILSIRCHLGYLLILVAVLLYHRALFLNFPSKFTLPSVN